MADPLSILGAGLGAASLVLQLTDECIKRYKFFTEASHMPENFRYLRVRLQIEQQRFISFAIAAGLLSEGEGGIDNVIHTNETLLREILLEIHKLFVQFETINGRYVAFEEQANHETAVEEPGLQTSLADLVCRTQPTVSRHCRANPGENSFDSHTQKILSISGRAMVKAKKLRVVLTEPKRLVWVSSDRDTFEVLLKRLGELNSFLSTLLDESKMLKQEKAIESSYLEILHLRNDILQLQDLMNALDSADEVGQTRAIRSMPNSDTERKAYFKELAWVKISRLAIDKLNLSTAYVSQLDLTPTFAAINTLRWHTSGDQRTLQQWDGRAIWCEQVFVPPTKNSQQERRDNQTEDRLALLASLLSKQLPERFRTPLCLGFVRAVNAKESKLGLIFEKPPNISKEDRPIDLRYLLDLRPKPKPPLLSRLRTCIALAESVFHFHAVNWLHKGIRGENVLFFTSSFKQSCSKPLALPRPYVAGFDLSRPGNETDMTARSAFDPTSDIYRHPLALASDSCGAYRKSYDLYSLGILLLEVGCWKRIDKLLNVSLEDMKPRELHEVRESLLSGCITELHTKEQDPLQLDNELSSCLQRAADKCGDAFRDVVEICLVADHIEKPMYRGETRAAIAQRLRTVFEEQILDRLRKVIEVLEGADHNRHVG